jgi:hypothetical protein
MDRGEASPSVRMRQYLSARARASVPHEEQSTNRAYWSGLASQNKPYSERSRREPGGRSPIIPVCFQTSTCLIPECHCRLVQRCSQLLSLPTVLANTLTIVNGQDLIEKGDEAFKGVKQGRF